MIAAHVLVGDGNRVDQFCDEMARTPLGSRDDVSGYPVLGFMAGASIVRRSVLLSVGGFAAQFLVGGEEELVALDLAGGSFATFLTSSSTITRHRFATPQTVVG